MWPGLMHAWVIVQEHHVPFPPMIHGDVGKAEVVFWHF
jgi:hypothetical protein